MILSGQTALWCGCGRAEIFAQGRCASCYRAWRHSERRFGGLRQRVLLRDSGQCLCGEISPELILVHHRRPGVHRMPWLVTLCRRCHCRIHHTWRPGFGFPEYLRALWREQFPDIAVQLELGLQLASQSDLEAIQAALFEAA